MEHQKVIRLTKIQMTVIRVIRGETSFKELHYKKSSKTSRTKRARAAIYFLRSRGYIEADANDYLTIAERFKTFHFTTK